MAQLAVGAQTQKVVGRLVLLTAPPPSLLRQAQPLRFLNSLLGPDGLRSDTEAPGPELSAVPGGRCDSQIPP